MAYAVGIDIGGTKMSGALLDQHGHVLTKMLVPTEVKKRGNEIIDNIITFSRRLRATTKIIGIGIGTPGFVLPNGKLASCYNIPSLMRVPVEKHLTEKIGFPVIIENDANCFAFAENKLGAGKNTRHMLGVIQGTGYGLGIIIDKKIYKGGLGGAGEPGHMYISPYAKKIHRKEPTVEDWISGPSLVKRYKANGGTLKDPTVFTLAQSTVQSKDPIARKVYNEMIHYLAWNLACLTNILNPERIVMGGGLSNLSYYEQLNKEFQQFVYPPLGKSVKIVKNKLGDDAGVIGAGLLVFIRILKSSRINRF